MAIWRLSCIAQSADCAAGPDLHLGGRGGLAALVSACIRRRRSAVQHVKGLLARGPPPLRHRLYVWQLS